MCTWLPQAAAGAHGEELSGGKGKVMSKGDNIFRFKVRGFRLTHASINRRSSAFA